MIKPIKYTHFGNSLHIADLTENCCWNSAYGHFHDEWIRFALMRVVNQLQILGNQLYEISFLDKCPLINGHYRVSITVHRI